MIRDRILNGYLQSGDRLAEAKLAEQLSVSRGPVREALKQLSAEGLVREEPRRGSFVAALTPLDIRDVYDLRAAIEPRAARLIVNAGDAAAIDTLRRKFSRIHQAAGSGNARQVVKADYAFHEAICRLSGNRRLLEVFLRHASLLQAFLRIDESFYKASMDIAEQHLELLEALESLDATLAEQRLVQHLEESRDRLLDHVAQGVDVSSQLATGDHQKER